MPDTHWVMAVLEEHEFSKIKPYFDNTVNSTPLTKKEIQIYSLYEENPSALVPKYIPRNQLPPEFDRKLYRNGFIDSRKYNDFSNIFIHDEFNKVFFKFNEIWKKEIIVKWLSHDSPLASILYYSLGAHITKYYPIHRGNILIHHDKLSEYKRLFSTIPNQPTDAILNTARKVVNTCSSGKLSYDYNDVINETFSALSNALDVAINKQKSLIVLSFWEG